jgi:outer membrane protein OmpA-like peptidoglycan-associated protein
MRTNPTTFASLAAILLIPMAAVAQPGSETPSTSGTVEPVAAEGVAPAPAVVTSETDERPRGFVPQLSLGGSVGLLHMGSAEVGNVGQLRLSLHGEYFTGTNVLASDKITGNPDKDTRLQGALTFGLTPIEHLEIFGAILGSGNRNQRFCGTTNGVYACTEPGRTDPELIKSFGDLILGTKLAYSVAPGFSAGGELGLRFLSSITGLSFSPSSTSVWLNAVGSYDFKQTAKNVPLRLHMNIGYYIDNSGNVISYTDANSADSRYVSRFAYGISESRFRLALGADAPFAELAEGFALRPIVEYHFEYLTGSADQLIASQPCGSDPAMPCRSNKDQHLLTLGVQAQVLHGLTFTVGLDLALRSVGYAYGPPLAPWNLLFGVGYPIDLVPRVITRNVPVEKVVVKETMREGLVAGKVISAPGTPIEGAVVGVTGREHSRVLTDADGTFQSVPLAPGPVELLVVANGYENATVKTEVIAGQTANIALTLTPRPPAARAVGHITDDAGKGIAATVKLAGPQIADGKSDDAGNFAIAVAPGQYIVRIDADQYLSKEMPLTVAEGRENPLNVTLRTRPAVAGVTFQDGKFKLRQAITFKSPGPKKPATELTQGMPHLLDEVVDILVNHPEIKQVRVEAHWDSSTPMPKVQTLTDDQAKAVAKYLTDQGISSDRVVPVGMGSSKPIVPNLGKGKLKNRRIEIVVVS